MAMALGPTALDETTERDHGGFFSGRLQALNRPIDPPREHLTVADWLFRSAAASVIWLVVRVWLGWQWLHAGYEKIWGSEKLGFWYGGSAVKGFAAGGVAQSHGAQPAVAYGWWAGFLHNFVAPNASWLGKVVALGEVAIGLGLILGLFTGLAAFFGVTLNMMYMLSGVAGVNPIYALLGVFLVLAWRNAGYIGLDRWVLPAVGTPTHPGSLFRRFRRTDDTAGMRQAVAGTE